MLLVYEELRAAARAAFLGLSEALASAIAIGLVWLALRFFEDVLWDLGLLRLVGQFLAWAVAMLSALGVRR